MVPMAVNARVVSPLAPVQLTATVASVGVVPTAYPFEDCTTDGSSCKGVIV